MGTPDTIGDFQINNIPLGDYTFSSRAVNAAGKTYSVLLNGRREALDVVFESSETRIEQFKVTFAP